MWSPMGRRSSCHRLCCSSSGTALHGATGAENAQRLRVFLAGNIGILPFEESDAAIAGDLRAALEANGTAIGPYDLLIAAQALRTGTTLATANVAEFARVPGLTWHDWTLEE